jgi:hypothetical protein
LTVSPPRFRKRFETAELRGMPADPDACTPRAAVALHSNGGAHLLFVVRLLETRGPAAVFRPVVAIIVEPIERVRARRARSHIGKERHEIVPPAVAHADAAGAIAPE